ncbi:MAG: VCBS repeat-containing protein, partial [Planctomycetota bacterium]
MMHLYPLLLPALLAPSTGDFCFEDQGDLHGLQPLGGGIATIDFDGDGYQDLILGGGFGSGTLSLYHNVPGAAAGSRTFQNVTAGSGFSDTDAAGRDMSGIVVADVDGDGLDDVFASGYLPSAGPQPQSSGLFYRNLGGGVFANETVTRGLRATGYRMDSCTFVDYDHDGDVDLFGLCRSNPNNYLLLENDGTGQFTNNMAPLPNAQYFFRAYSHLWTDFNGDGWEDCIVLVDGSPADVLRNDPAPGGGRMLSEVASSIGIGSLGMLPMGVACGD